MTSPDPMKSLSRAVKPSKSSIMTEIESHKSTITGYNSKLFTLTFKSQFKSIFLIFPSQTQLCNNKMRVAHAHKSLDFDPRCLNERPGLKLKKEQ